MKSQQVTEPAKELLSLSEAAAFLGITKSTLYKKTHRKEIPFYKPTGKLIYFLRQDLLNWALRNRSSVR
jgi:excisionase family DNA binding protein